jgi:tetratricopeptide (TPR) repeat protein
MKWCRVLCIESAPVQLTTCLLLIICHTSRAWSEDAGAWTDDLPVLSSSQDSVATQDIYMPAVETAAAVADTADVLLEMPAESGAFAADAAWEEAQDRLDNEYDFGDYSSQDLVVRAWESLILEEYESAQVYVNKCIEMYERKALEQQAGLLDFAPEDEAFDYWALNDVATAYFIRAKVNAQSGSVTDARNDLKHIIKKLGYAQAWDSRGWFWRVADAAKDQMSTVGTPYDYGDYTSQTLATRGWEALIEQDYKGVNLYAKKNIQLYAEEAQKQQASLTQFASRENVYDYWALNDVAVSYYQMGEALAAQKKFRQARETYQLVIDNYAFAQAWDPKGWFWKVAVAAKGRLRKLRAQEKRGW